MNSSAYLITLTAFVLSIAAQPSSLGSEKPNIVLVMADDQGWGDMAYNGHPVLQTPHFDKMAAESFRFDRFYAAAPVCSPTRGSVMTGRHPNRFGCFKWGHSLRPQEITIAEALRKAGYSTGHFGKWHLGSVRAGSPANPGANGFDEWFSAPNFFDNDAVLSDQGRAVPTEGESSMVTVEAALEFIERASDRQKPFLAVVWFGSPHRPHGALEKDRKLYADHSERLQHFYGEITAMDRAFGKLRSALDRLELRENTILWYCSDNGGLPEGSTGEFRGHKGSIYEGGLLVPAMLEWPARIKEPQTTNVRCTTSDIYPTLLEWTGLTIKNQPPLDGISLVPLIEGKLASRPRPVGFWEHPQGGISTPSKRWMGELLEAQRSGREPYDPKKLRLNAGEVSRQYPADKFPGHAAWIDGNWKLHRIAGKSGDQPRFELYNLQKDPYEKSDVLDEEPDRANRMQQSLEEWQRAVVRSLNGHDYN